MKKAARTLLLFLVSAAALLNAPVLSGLVLCMGQDGHLELEYSINGRCSAGDEAAREAALHAAAGENHCGPCTDVSLIGAVEESFRSAKVTVLHAGLDLLLPAPVPAFHLERIATVLLAQPPPGGSPHLPHLLTVRLLV